jgi:MSHA biogenesis protein MshP
MALVCPSAGAGYSFAMPPNTSLSAFTVTVTCTAPVNSHYIITATACNDPLVVPNVSSTCPNVVFGPDYVQRVVQAQL